MQKLSHEKNYFLLPCNSSSRFFCSSCSVNKSVQGKTHVLSTAIFASRHKTSLAPTNRPSSAAALYSTVVYTVPAEKRNWRKKQKWCWLEQPWWSGRASFIIYEVQDPSTHLTLKSFSSLPVHWKRDANAKLFCILSVGFTKVNLWGGKLVVTSIFVCFMSSASRLLIRTYLYCYHCLSPKAITASRQPESYYIFCLSPNQIRTNHPEHCLHSDLLSVHVPNEINWDWIWPIIGVTPFGLIF